MYPGRILRSGIDEGGGFVVVRVVLWEIKWNRTSIERRKKMMKYFDFMWVGFIFDAACCLYM